MLSLCLPTLASDGKWSRAAWGRIDCLNINFRTLSNRLRAVQWYINQMLERWEEQHYRNLKLVGVYWIEESIYTNTDLVKAVNNYVHSKGLRSYWIPYFFNDAIPDSQIDEAIDLARVNGLDMEFEFDSSALHSREGSKHSRM